MKFRIVFRKGTRVNIPHTTNKLLRDITIPLWNIKLTNLVILIKKFPEFIQKIQNTSFIHQK